VLAPRRLDGNRLQEHNYDRARESFSLHIVAEKVVTSLTWGNEGSEIPPIPLQLLKAGITPDSRSNGPAICSFLLAGGIRPVRETGKGWNIHHLYDGKFPFDKNRVTTHAVKDGGYFTEAAGLVALHPLADAMADEFCDFAWWLRRGAYDKFGFDPDCVFKEMTSDLWLHNAT
jgi:hypothetical protein